ncbi:LPXTG cell wall anchor domain-containing protein [Periweissella cryptocerci]|uniref:LPXTG cell wall anchor domain-containing protein n=1 Tax=Periweissella cryptocerci TaxID=2506420 RepID=A0A4P6YT71_9LACO|nr:SpaA isopeptide-forming pilin-related protein [Periweissella cryptocerci]QBO35881.1 LPXTG cell wall anchor domain-containing protein [Periweissella cryptocerci]
MRNKWTGIFVNLLMIVALIVPSLFSAGQTIVAADKSGGDEVTKNVGEGHFDIDDEHRLAAMQIDYVATQKDDSIEWTLKFQQAVDESKPIAEERIVGIQLKADIEGNGLGNPQELAASPKDALILMGNQVAEKEFVKYGDEYAEYELTFKTAIKDLAAKKFEVALNPVIQAKENEQNFAKDISDANKPVIISIDADKLTPKDEQGNSNLATTPNSESDAANKQEAVKQKDTKKARALLTDNPANEAKGTETVESVKILNNSFAGGTGATDASKFGLWVSNKNSTRFSQVTGDNPNSTDLGNMDGKAVHAFEKFNRPRGSIEVNPNPSDGGKPYNPSSNTYNNLMYWARTHYHWQYEQHASTNNGQSSYMIEFANENAVKDYSFAVTYDDVGTYTGTDMKDHKMGAVMSVSNIQWYKNSEPFNGTNMPHFIDIPNNLFSGIFYRGIANMDIEIRYYSVDGNGKLNKLLNVEPDDGVTSYLTFGSLNNFGPAGATGNANNYDWTVTTTGINNSVNAEMVGKVGSDGKLIANATILSKDSIMKATSKQNELYYSTGHGNYDKLKSGTHQNGNFIDALGASDFENGAVSFEVTGKVHKFRIYTGTGNTWQTIFGASIDPMPLVAPSKTVTTSPKPAGDSTSSDKHFGTIVNGAEQYGNLHMQSVDDIGHYTKNGQLYDTFYYYIYQQTYQIGVDSIAKPNKMVMVDWLPANITLKDGKQDVVVYDQRGQVIPRTFTGTDNKTYERYVVTANDAQMYEDPITKDKELRQMVMVNFTAEGIGVIDFDGSRFAIGLHVKVDATLADKANTTIWRDNTASMQTFLGTQDTNTVKVREEPKKIEVLKGKFSLLKVDEKFASVEGAEFTLTKDGDPSFTLKPNPIGNKFTFSDLNPGTYTLVETKTPDGYIRDKDSYKIIVAENGDVSWADTDVTFDNDNNAQVVNHKEQIGLELVKVDQDNSPLEGAKFQIRLSSQNHEWVDMVADGNIHRVPSDFEFITYQTYEIREVETPDGYLGIHSFRVQARPVPEGFVSYDPNRPEDIRFEITADGYRTQIIIPNHHKGYQLPATGSIGIMVILGLGITLMAGSVFIFRRLNNN